MTHTDFKFHHIAHTCSKEMSGLGESITLALEPICE